MAQKTITARVQYLVSHGLDRAAARRQAEEEAAGVDVFYVHADGTREIPNDGPTIFDQADAAAPLAEAGPSRR